MKGLIIYYSTSGNTENLAKKIQNDLGCDLLKVEVEKTYGNFLSSVIRVAGERKRNEITKVITELPDLSAYDTIFVGAPVWYSEPPAFFSDFLHKCNFSEKTVIPFATSNGSGGDATTDKLIKDCSCGNAILPFSTGKLKKADYETWITSVKSKLSV